MSQLLLLPDPRPLDARLGRDFFRQAPERAGVYLMRDAADNVVYVGKAKNLRQRLQHYRVANPDRMPRRHLRMLRQVARIEFLFCPGEAAALQREAKLLRSLKPKFNRAGVWPTKTKFLAWRISEQRLELAAVDVPENGWRRYGPLGSHALHLQAVLARSLWLALHPQHGIHDLPLSWAQGRLAESITLNCGAAIEQIALLLDGFFWSATNELLHWFENQSASRTHAFERIIIASELEALKVFSENHCEPGKFARQLALL